jgi:hypothetical protein
MGQTDNLRSQIFFTIILLLLIVLSYGINPSQGKSEGDNNYLIKFTHTKESCLAALEKISKDDEKLLAKIDWGCMSGDHTGYMMVSGKDEKSVKDMIAKSIRDQVTIEKVDKFTKEQIESYHK